VNVEQRLRLLRFEEWDCHLRVLWYRPTPPSVDEDWLTEVYEQWKHGSLRRRNNWIRLLVLDYLLRCARNYNSSNPYHYDRPERVTRLSWQLLEFGCLNFMFYGAYEYTENHRYAKSAIDAFSSARTRQLAARAVDMAETAVEQWWGSFPSALKAEMQTWNRHWALQSNDSKDRHVTSESDPTPRELYDQHAWWSKPQVDNHSLSLFCDRCIGPLQPLQQMLENKQLFQARLDFIYSWARDIRAWRTTQTSWLLQRTNDAVARLVTEYIEPFPMMPEFQVVEQLPWADAVCHLYLYCAQCFREYIPKKVGGLKE